MIQPLYQQIADRLRSELAGGVYRIGEQLPTENELAGQLGVSRPTVRQALDLLAREGSGPADGARPLRRRLHSQVEDPVADGLLSGRFQSGDALVLTVRENALAIEKEME